MSNVIPIFQLLIAFGAFQAFFIALILLFKAPAKLYYRLFAVFLLIEGVTLVERVLAETGYIELIPHLVGVSYPINFIKPPMLLAIAWAMMDPGFRLKRKHLWHAIPFGIMLALNMPFYFESAAAKVEMATTFINYVPTYQSFNFYLFCSFYLYIGIYLFLALRRIFNNPALKPGKLARAYGNVLKIYAGALFIFLLYFLISPAQILVLESFNTISMVIMTLIIQSVAYSLLSGSRIITNNRGTLDPTQMAEDRKRLQQKMEDERLFLNDALSLSSFARDLDLPKTYVSQIINQGFGISFKEWINNYRVEMAVELMKQQTQTSMIDIALNSGFNNKVSFYRSFKRVTGKSPSEYYNTV